MKRIIFSLMASTVLTIVGIFFVSLLPTFRDANGWDLFYTPLLLLIISIPISIFFFLIIYLSPTCPLQR